MPRTTRTDRMDARTIYMSRCFFFCTNVLRIHYIHAGHPRDEREGEEDAGEHYWRLYPGPARIDFLGRDKKKENGERTVLEFSLMQRGWFEKRNGVPLQLRSGGGGAGGAGASTKEPSLPSIYSVPATVDRS